jgi:hypothetical protein
MFCAPGLIFGGSEGVGSPFHVLHSRTRFRRYRGRPVPFSFFALLESFSAVPRASGPVFMFCVPGLIFGGTEGVGSCFHVLRSRTRFRRYRGRRLPFSCFAFSDPFSSVPRASGPVFFFCAPELIFGGIEVVGSRFHVLRARTHFRCYRGSRVLFSCFALPYTFSAVPRASGTVFMFCVPGLDFSDTEGLVSHFHVLRSLTRSRQYRGCRLLFSCLALPDSFSTVPRASALVFMFSAPGLDSCGTMCVESRFHVLRRRTRFRWYRVRRVPFSCLALRDSFLAVPRASAPVFMFCAPGNVFGGTDGVWSRFQVLHARTLFRRYRGRRVPF